MKKNKTDAAAQKETVKDAETGAATEKIKDCACGAENSRAAAENGGATDGNGSERACESERARKSRNDKVLICFVALFCAFILFFTGFFAGSCGNAATRKAKEIIRLIDKYSVTVEGDADKDEVARAIVSALLADDKYAVYYSKEEYARVLNEDKGVYAGAGFTFLSDENGNITGDVLFGVQSNSPAFKAGVKAGDKIVAAKIAAGGERREFSDNAALVSFLSEVPAYTDITFYVVRGEELSEREFTFAKENYTVSYVNYYDCDDRMYFYSENAGATQARVAEGEGKPELADDTALIEFGAFEGDAAREFKTALDYMRDKGKTKLVLDLRNNGGGLVSEAVNIADIFIDSGVITYTEDRNGSKQEYKADGEKDDIKMSVLVNENSASSSEILAGALKDNGYKIVGEKTFGKGIIQQTMELDDGSAVKLTVAQYFTPDGHKVHKKGISPNVEVKNSSSGDRQLDKALSILN